MKLISKLFRRRPAPALPVPQPQTCAACQKYAEMIELANAYGNNFLVDHLRREYAAHLEIHKQINPYTLGSDL